MIDPIASLGLVQKFALILSSFNFGGFLLWSVVFHHMLHSKFHRLMMNFTASIGPFGMV